MTWISGCIFLVLNSQTITNAPEETRIIRLIAFAILTNVNGLRNSVSIPILETFKLWFRKILQVQTNRLLFRYLRIFIVQILADDIIVFTLSRWPNLCSPHPECNLLWPKSLQFFTFSEFILIMNSASKAHIMRSNESVLSFCLHFMHLFDISWILFRLVFLMLTCVSVEEHYNSFMWLHSSLHPKWIDFWNDFIAEA